MTPIFSLVLPCRNQSDHIGAILLRYLRSLETTNVPFELVVVPNASTDGTEQVVEDMGRRDPRIRVVINPAGGWGLSVRTGLDFCRGSILAYTNTARTEPDVLPDFLARYQQNPGTLVKARRVHRAAPMRQIGSTLYNLEARVLFGLRTGDVNGTPKIFSADLLRMFPLHTTGDLLDLELMSQARRHDVEIVEIPLPGFKRHGGKSSTTLASAWNMYVGALKLRWATV